MTNKLRLLLFSPDGNNTKR